MVHAMSDEPVLDKPARIGSTNFGKGVKWSTVIRRAQREYERAEAIKAEEKPRLPVKSEKTRF